MTTPLLNPTPPQGEEQKVAQIFAGIEEKFGFVPDGLKLYAFSPPLLESFLGNVGYFSAGQTVSAEVNAMIRYLISVKNDCSFCIDLNEAFLSNMGYDLDKVRATRDDIDSIPMSDADKVLIKLALKSAKDPNGVSRDDIETAKQAGFSERHIFDAVAQALSNQAFNYLLETFKVEHQGAFA